MKRHLFIIALVSFILPGTLLAQDELTLDSLQALITALDERLSAIEEQFADPWSPDFITEDGVCQSPLHTGPENMFGRIALEETVHQETADAYRAQYGTSVDPKDARLMSLSFSVDSSEVFIEYELNKRYVVETWAHCEYLGHSEWTD